MDDDALEIALAAGMSIPEAMAFADTPQDPKQTPQQQPQQPQQSKGCLVALLIVGLVVLIACAVARCL
jgi:hypothetical protein